MSVAEAQIVSAAPAAIPPPLAMPPRPPRPLSTLQLLRTGITNTLATCDEELFDELFVERRFLGQRAFVISDPDAIKRILLDNYDNYPRPEQSRRMFHFGSGTGMICAEGELWRRHRRIINPTLDYRAIQPDVPKLVEFAEEVVRDLAAVPPGQDIDIGKSVARFMSAATGYLFAGNDPRIDELVRELARFPGKFGFVDILPVPASLGFVARLLGGRRIAEKFEPVLRPLLTERRREDYTGTKDLLWRLVQGRDRATGEGLTDSEVCDEVFSLGNTAITPLRVLSWVWYLLALHPAVEAELHAELDAVLDGRPPAYEDFPKLPYLRRVIDETMRLYPPLPVMVRTVTEDDVAGGRPLPRNAVLTIAPWIVHRHRRLWAEPDRFDPDRFRPENSVGRSRFAYIPFSIGPHICTGAPLSIVQILVVVAILAQRFRFRLVPGHPIEPVGWTSLRPAHGIRVTVEARRR